MTVDGEAPLPDAAAAGGAGPFTWHILAGHYPPEPGGVADYTRLVGAALAAVGDQVHIWCAALPADARETPADPGVEVHRIDGGFEPQGLARLGAALDAHPHPRRILLQWVPHSFGRRSLNVGFVAWLHRRHRRSGDTIEVVAHEGGLGFGEGGVLHNAAALVHRLMALALVQTSRRIWVSIPEWERRWGPLRFGRRVEFRWLPVPSNISVTRDPAAAEVARALLARAPRVDAGTESGEGGLVAHFGTFGEHHLPQLRTVFTAMLRDDPSFRLGLLGPGGERLLAQLVETEPAWRVRVIATGALSAPVLSACLSLADVVVQPYTDGISGRRGSAMAPLAHGCAVVTTEGFLTEPLWRESGAVALAPAEAAERVAAEALRLLHDAPRRARLARAARALYEERFSVARVVSALRAAAASDDRASARPGGQPARPAVSTRSSTPLSRAASRS